MKNGHNGEPNSFMKKAIKIGIKGPTTRPWSSTSQCGLKFPRANCSPNHKYSLLSAQESIWFSENVNKAIVSLKIKVIPINVNANHD